MVGDRDRLFSTINDDTTQWFLYTSLKQFSVLVRSLFAILRYRVG
ncbi:hypothetical protein [Nostoc sp.]